MKLSNSHGGYAGRSLIERIQTQLDRQNKRVHAMQGPSIPPNNVGIDSQQLMDYAIAVGRAEGMAAALAILRSSSVTEELDNSSERIN